MNLFKRKKWEPSRITDYPGNGLSHLSRGTFYQFSYHPQFKSGEAMRAKMQSGKTALLKIVEVETPGDPGDQHFIKTEFVKYLD